MTKAALSVDRLDLFTSGMVNTRLTAERNFKWTVALSCLHIPLGVIIFGAGSLAMLHPAAVLCIGLYWALNKSYRLELTAFAMAYLVGAEVLWRMAQVPVFWEFGKYGSALIALVSLIRRGRFVVPGSPLVYFAVLVPGCVLTLLTVNLTDAQGIFSFQLSGPFFLVVACWYFSYCELDPVRLRQLFLAVALPLISVAIATLFFTVTNENIQFSGESNLATSGGFGPNQVSSMLGLGAFMSLASLLIFRNEPKLRIYYMLTAILFSAQSIMTFSRGGMYNAIGAIIVVALIEFRSPSIATRRIAPIVGLLLLFLVLVFPTMDAFTGGLLKDRFSDAETTGRTEIVEADIQLFLDNPMFGVGVGASYDLRAQFLDHKAMSHTEFSRLLAEHGMFGVAALFFLAYMMISRFREQRILLGKALVAGAAVWACLFMTNAAMRLAAPSFMLGLMYSTILEYGRAGRRTGQVAFNKTRVGPRIRTN